MPAQVTDPTANADPAAVRALAGRFESIANTAGQLRSNLGGAGGTWTGAAAQRFATRLDELPPELERVTGAFHQAAGALNTWAADIEELRHQARASMQQFSAANGRITTLDRAAQNSTTHPDARAIAAHEDAVADAKRAGDSMHHVADELDRRAHVCQSKIDAAAFAMPRSALGNLLLGVHLGLNAKDLWKDIKSIGAAKKDIGLFIGRVRGDAYAARDFGLSMWKRSYKSTLNFRSSVEKGIAKVGKVGGRMVAKGGRWTADLGKSIRKTSGKALKMFKSKGATKWLRIGGRALGVVGVALSGISAVSDIAHGHYMDAAFDAAGFIGGAILIAGSAAVIGVVGTVAAPFVLAGAVVAVTASVIYSNRKLIVAGARVVGDTAAEGVARARGDDAAAARSDFAQHRRMSETWTAFSQ